MLFVSSQPRIGAKIMTDKESSADKVGDHATDDDSPHAYQAPDRPRLTDVLKHRWPIALGVAVAALAAFDLQDGLEFAAPIVLMALVYLGAAALDRRWFAWVVLLGGVLLVLFFRSISENDRELVSVVFLVAAAVLVVLGVARGQLRRPGGLPLQAAGMLVFGSIAVVALFYVDPSIGGKLVAIALIGHATWDAYHYVRNRVVPRSYAEWCAVVDLLLGAAILFMT
jgi:hypothetical protein